MSPGRIASSTSNHDSSSKELDLTEPSSALSGGRPSVRRSVSYQLVAQLIGVASSLVALPILSRYLGLSGFGIYVTVTSFASLMTTVADLGLGATAVREMSSGRLPDGPTSTTAAVLRCVTALIVVVIGTGIAVAQGQPHDVVIGLVLSTISVVATCAASAGGVTIFQSKGRFGWTVINAAVQSPIWILSVGFIAAAHLSVLCVFVALGLSSIVGMILALVTARRLCDDPPRFDLSIARQLLGQGTPFGVAAVLAVTYYKVDTIILSSIAGSVAVGIYGASYRFIDQVRQLASFVGIAFQPILSRDPSNGASFRAELGRLVRFASLAGATAAVSLFAGADLATRLIFGVKFVESAGLLRILSLAVLPMFLNAGLQHAIIARRKHVLYLPINAAALVFNVVGNYVLIPHFGSVASAALTGLTEILVLTVTVVAMRRALGMAFSLRPFLGACTAFIVAIVVYLVTVQQNDLLAATSSLASYVTVLLILRVVDLQTITGLARQGVAAISRPYSR